MDFKWWRGDLRHSPLTCPIDGVHGQVKELTKVTFCSEVLSQVKKVEPTLNTGDVSGFQQ